MVGRLALLIVCSAVSSTACASKSARDPFVVQPEQLPGRLQVLAIPPVAFPDDLLLTDSIVSSFHTEMTTVLRNADFTVIGQDQVADLWEPILDDIGGYYDPRTGAILEEKRATANQRFRSQLRERYGTDAIVYAELILVDAPYADGIARWDGASQSVAGFWDKLFEAVAAVAAAVEQEPYVSALPVGTAPAITFQVVVEDLGGRELYANWGGVVLIADVDSGEWLEAGEAFRDFERIQKAVDIAMKPFVERTRQPTPTSPSKIEIRE